MIYDGRYVSQPRILSLIGKLKTRTYSYNRSLGVLRRSDTGESANQEQFRQVTVWLKNVSGRKLPELLRTEIDQVLDETKTQEAAKMISNIERALDKMQRRALLDGKAEGVLEGKAEVAGTALRKGFSLTEMVNTIEILYDDEISK